MDTRDQYGRAYSNEQSRFYVPEKNAKVGIISHAFRWKSGKLEGFCTEERHRQRKSRSDEQGGKPSVAMPVIVDHIILQETALFDTASPRISNSGRQSLTQLINRIAAYEDVRRIEMEGHTDDRGSVQYNQALSQDRVASVKAYLTEKIAADVPIMSSGSGELKPIDSNSSAAGMRQNRRVEVRVIASRVSDHNKNSTLCHPTPAHLSTTKPLTLADAEQSRDDKTAWRLADFTGHLPISVGDQLRIAVAGDDNFNGIYAVTIGGGIDLPLLGSVPVLGLTVDAIKKTIGERLVENQYIHKHALSVDTAIQQWATINVFVRGAVFDPGRVAINHKKPEEKEFINRRNAGDYAANRLLSTALRQAGGIRPDANLAAIEVLRNGKKLKVDLSGMMDGELAQDLPLISGDEVIVPSTGYFQGELARPTQLTTPGIRVFMSNPTVPIYSNTSAAIDKDAFSVPYGTRFLRGLVSANCVGGTQHTNASRRGVLISTNPFTGATEVIERSVQQLISDPDRDDINPHLLPNDGIACYDSDVSNIRDVARSLSDVLAPFVDLTTLFRTQ